MIKAIIFDFDGVLVESVNIKTDAFVRLFANENSEKINLIKEYHLNNTGVSRYEKFRYIYKNILKRELTNDQFSFQCNSFAKCVTDAVVAAPYVDGAKSVLERYSGKLHLFVASATPQDEIQWIIDKRCMSRYFDQVFGSPVSKEEAVSSVLIKLGISGNEAIYIGDALSDYRAATANGLNFVARINENKDIFMNIECQRITNLTELPGIITDLDARGAKLV